jgi:nucleoside-diphosphate-sugar epimerase
MTQPVFIAGCGYVGRRLIERLHSATYITALSHSPEHSRELEDLGITVTTGDLDRVESQPDLSQASDSTLFYFIPPPSSGTSDPRLTRFLAWLQPTALPRRIVLISATGVYGDCDGAWIDETRPAAPNSDRGRRRLAAEQTLLQWSERQGVTAIILRVAGIYGPGRLPQARLEKALPVLDEQQAPWSNRIHIDDLVSACLAAATQGGTGRCYNICDDQPSTMTDYFFRVAAHLGLPRPPTLSLEQARTSMSPGMLSYLAESRRLINRRLREELGVELRHPNLEAGLKACKDV